MTEALVLITDAYIACTVPNVLCNCLTLDPPLVNIYLMSLKTFERKSYCIFDVISLTIRLIVAPLPMPVVLHLNRVMHFCFSLNIYVDILGFSYIYFC